MATTALEALARLYRDDKSEFDSRQRAFNRWQKLTSPKLSARAIGRMQGSQFGDLLAEMDTARWDGLTRLRGRLSNPRKWPAVKKALIRLVDERRPLVDRLDALRPAGKRPPVAHLGPAVITGILHLIAPEKYGVWNGTSSKSMKRLGLWPRASRGTSFADRYLLVNSVVLDTASRLGLPVCVVDSLWWHALQKLGNEEVRRFKQVVNALPADLDAEFSEGGQSLRTHLARERNSTVVLKAKSHWSQGGIETARCCVCGWSMEDVYGKAGAGFVEAHHCEPLGRARTGVTTRVEDLVPVCPNCHRILHRSGFEVERLRKVVRSRGMARS